MGLDAPLNWVFTRLFLVSPRQAGRVATGRWRGCGLWSFFGGVGFLCGSKFSRGDLLQVLSPINTMMDEDSWEWWVDSVRSAYLTLGDDFSTVECLSQVVCLDRLWRSLAPPKVVAFAWQVLLDQLATWVNLFQILDPNAASCALCGTTQESTFHLFLRCPFTQRVWYEVFSWLGWQLPLPPNLFRLFVVSTLLGCRARGLCLICHCVIWLIWEGMSVFLPQKNQTLVSWFRGSCLHHGGGFLLDQRDQGASIMSGWWLRLCVST